jgi:ectoine hydroxylase-related dioxygenase (phytanoyl-CoA dioxygenase family)
MTMLLTDGITLTDDVLRDHIRSVTDEEVAFYDENGWVKLSGLLSPELTALVLTHVKDAAGYVEEDGFTEAFTDLDTRGETRTAWYSTNLHHKDDFLKQLARSRPLGEAHARLMHTERVRLWSDSTNTKPAGAELTPWHQDMQAFPFDRPEGGGMWVALVEITPEMAPLQHLSGSHREPWAEPTEKDPTKIFTPGDSITAEEALKKYAISPSQHLQPGDVLAHHALTFHGTEHGNDTDKIRWTWISQRFPADITYIDKRNSRSDGLGLVPGKELDHEFFPVVTEA